MLIGLPSRLISSTQSYIDQTIAVLRGVPDFGDASDSAYVIVRPITAKLAGAWIVLFGNELASPNCAREESQRWRCCT